MVEDGCPSSNLMLPCDPVNGTDGLYVNLLNLPITNSLKNIWIMIYIIINSPLLLLLFLQILTIPIDF